MESRWLSSRALRFSGGLGGLGCSGGLGGLGVVGGLRGLGLRAGKQGSSWAPEIWRIVFLMPTKAFGS